MFAQTVDTSSSSGGLEGRTPHFASGRGFERDRQLGTKRRREGAQSSAVFDGLPDESLAPAKGPSRLERKSFGSEREEREAVETMETKLEDMGKEKN